MKFSMMIDGIYFFFGFSDKCQMNFLSAIGAAKCISSICGRGWILTKFLKALAMKKMSAREDGMFLVEDNIIHANGARFCRRRRHRRCHDVMMILQLNCDKAREKKTKKCFRENERK